MRAGNNHPVGLHDDALAVLTGWAAYSPEQAALRDRFVDHLRDRPDATTRGCFPAHFTAGTLVVSDDRRHVLLNLHGKAKRWFHFGGHCEPGDTSLRGTAEREAREESGLASFELLPGPVQLSAHPVPFCHQDGVVDHLDVRYVAVAPYVEPVVSEESLDVRWWPVESVPTDEPEMLELIALAVGQSR